MTTTRPWLPLAAVAFTLVTWSSAFVAIRHLGEDVPPGSLSLGRLVVAVIALGAMVLISVPAARRRLPTRREWPLIALGGVSWIGIYNVALNESERRIDAGTAALIVQIGPIIVALLATFFFQRAAHQVAADRPGRRLRRRRHHRPRVVQRRQRRRDRCAPLRAWRP